MLAAARNTRANAVMTSNCLSAESATCDTVAAVGAHSSSAVLAGLAAGRTNRSSRQTPGASTSGTKASEPAITSAAIRVTDRDSAPTTPPLVASLPDAAATLGGGAPAVP